MPSLNAGIRSPYTAHTQLLMSGRFPLLLLYNSLEEKPRWEARLMDRRRLKALPKSFTGTARSLLCFLGTI